MTTSDSALFDVSLVARVAEQSDVDVDRLAALASELQSIAESVRSVDELVFEYRKAFGDVVAGRTERAYLLLVPPHVWPEFEGKLDATADELSALRELHAAAFDQGVANQGVENESGRDADPQNENRQPLVLYR